MKLITTLALLVASTAVYAQLQDIKVPADQALSTQSADAARAQLNAMGVKYLWKMDGSDVTIKESANRGSSELFVADFMGNGDARSEETEVSLKTCFKRGERLDSFVMFERPSPDYPVGGHLKVQEKVAYSKITKTTPFTIGGWFKQYPNYIEDFRNIGPGSLAGGYMPALMRFAKSTATQPGSMEWSFKLTSERGYVNINRQFTGQNDMNQQLPWWAHTYGTCYQGNNHQDCWHYISVAVNPAKNTVQFVIVRQPGWFFADDDRTDFVSTGITDAYLNNIDIPTSPRSVLHIGASDTDGTHGLIRGLFFATKALTPVESKALSNYTAPSKKGFMCGGFDLK